MLQMKNFVDTNYYFSSFSNSIFMGHNGSKTLKPRNLVGATPHVYIRKNLLLLKIVLANSQPRTVCGYKHCQVRIWHHISCDELDTVRKSA